MTHDKVEPQHMDRELRILLLEDVTTDAELTERELLKANISFAATRVATKEAYLAELTNNPDIILADFSLPGFSGSEALALAREKCPDIPFVFVSGAIGEERAIESLKQGATDYVLKQRLSRLVPAVERALRETEERVERKRAEEALRQSEERLCVLLDINNAIIANLDRASLFDAIAQALQKVLPFHRASLALHDPATDVIRIYALAGTTPSRRFAVTTGAAFPRQGSHLAEVLDTREYRLRRDLENESRVGLENALLEDGIRSDIAVPLISKGEAFGTLNVGSREPDAYSDGDAEFLVEVAHQVALAIQNMWAYEEIAELKVRLEQENVYLQEEIKTQHNFEEIVGRGPAIKKVLKAIETVAPTDATVLICSETGTGKELVARAVHNLSPRKGKALVKINCAALPSNLIESELFGHERGAFTGALSRRIGRFELANGGTIFLDEIGDMPLDMQTKLLRVLQDGEFERVGGTQTIKVDVRVIAATNRDLDKAMQDERFRSDLYYRLNVFPISLPALRDRKEDIELLVRHFVRKCCKRIGKGIETIPQQSLAALVSYSWPGNIRELENVIERAVIISEGSELQLGHWSPRATGTRAEPRMPTMEQLERDHILTALEITGWRVGGEQGAAKLLGLKRTTLQARMEKLAIKRER